jgi:hypothetical protein
MRNAPFGARAERLFLILRKGGGVMGKWIAPTFLAGLVALSLAACGSGGATAGPPASASETAPFPVSIETAEGTVTIDERPSSIVSL